MPSARRQAEGFVLLIFIVAAGLAAAQISEDLIAPAVITAFVLYCVAAVSGGSKPRKKRRR